MAAEFDYRISEDLLRGLIENGKNISNSCKNQLNSILTIANTVTVADLTRLGCTDTQKTQLTNAKAKFQAIYDEIIAQGF